MADLAEQPPGQYIPLREISERQDISEKYLEAILRKLVSAGLLNGRRGKKGGYRLTKSPAEYNLHEILVNAEGSVAPVACLMEPSQGCERVNQCRTFPTWVELDTLLHDFLVSRTLEDLVAPWINKKRSHEAQTQGE